VPLRTGDQRRLGDRRSCNLRRRRLLGLRLQPHLAR